MVGLFVNLLRIPYSYLYPCILCFCILGTYSVANSLVDVWILLVMGGIGYVLRKFGYDLAPVALGLVLAPMLELSLRQSLAMSAGDYGIFVQRPIAAVMFALGAVLLLLALKPLVFKGKDWREQLM
jgi:putative tricarboxylic transport membrane protein